MKKLFNDIGNLLSLGLILFWTYMLLSAGHFLGLVFLMVFVVFGVMEIWRRICWYQSERRIKRYIESGFTKYE